MKTLPILFLFMLQFAFSQNCQLIKGPLYHYKPIDSLHYDDKGNIVMMTDTENGDTMSLWKYKKELLSAIEIYDDGELDYKLEVFQDESKRINKVISYDVDLEEEGDAMFEEEYRFIVKYDEQSRIVEIDDYADGEFDLGKEDANSYYFKYDKKGNLIEMKFYGYNEYEYTKEYTYNKESNPLHNGQFFVYYLGEDIADYVFPLYLSSSRLKKSSIKNTETKYVSAPLSATYVEKNGITVIKLIEEDGETIDSVFSVSCK